ncbi:MAG TPA: hypothetical protein VEK33_12485 [Terriglobales bacterium]|nr:hypothetical protein [Terriglobales bacterium]
MKLGMVVLLALVGSAVAKDTRQYIAAGSNICVAVDGSFDNYLITAMNKEGLDLKYFDGNDKPCDTATYTLKGTLDGGGENEKGHHGHNHNTEFTAAVRLVTADGRIAWSGTSGKPALAEKTAEQLAKEIKRSVR